MKVKASADVKVKLASNLSHLQRTTLGKLPMKQGSAEFWLVIGRDGSVEQVQFISGAEAFRSLEKTIAGLKFKSLFPDNAPTKLLRRGALVCLGADYSCDFTLQDPRSTQFSGQVKVITK